MLDLAGYIIIGLGVGYVSAWKFRSTFVEFEKPGISEMGFRVVTVLMATLLPLAASIIVGEFVEQVPSKLITAATISSISSFVGWNALWLWYDRRHKTD